MQEIPKRLKRLFSLPAIPSWIVIIWKVAERLDTMNFILEQFDPFWKFLSSPIGTSVVLVIGFGILIFLVVKPEKKRKDMTITQHSQELTQEYIAERLSFIQQLRAVGDQLVKKVHFNIPESATHYFTKFCEESDVRAITQLDNMATTAIRLITERFHNLTFQSLENQTRGQKLTPSTITDDDIRNECNRISQAVSEYRRLVDEWMKFTKALVEKEIPKFWEKAPWSVNIHKKLADDYDELMASVKNLRNVTPRAFQNLLPRDDQLSKFPRVPLVG